ncbi:hypothetical protein YC2023_075654 [Brassica napus]
MEISGSSSKMLNKYRFHDNVGCGNKMTENNVCNQTWDGFSEEFLTDYSDQGKASKNVETSHNNWLVYEDLNRVPGIKRVDSAISDVADSPWILFAVLWGTILPRSSDGKLRYIGGETRIISTYKQLTLVPLFIIATERGNLNAVKSLCYKTFTYSTKTGFLRFCSLMHHQKGKFPPILELTLPNVVPRYTLSPMIKLSQSVISPVTSSPKLSSVVFSIIDIKSLASSKRFDASRTRLHKGPRLLSLGTFSLGFGQFSATRRMFVTSSKAFLAAKRFMAHSFFHIKTMP